MGKGGAPRALRLPDLIRGPSGGVAGNSSLNVTRVARWIPDRVRGGAKGIVPMTRFVLAALLLASPAHATADPITIDDVTFYLQARAADADGAIDAAVRDYARALDRAPDNPVVAIRAFREAVRAGDLALADRAAAVLDAQKLAPGDAPLLALASAARDRNAPAAQAAIAKLATGQLAVLAAPLRAWAAFDAGVDPFAPLAAPTDDAVARRFVEETRALLLIATGKTDAGLVALRVVLGTDQASQDNRIAAARLLVARGRSEQARTLLTGDAPAIAALRTRPAPATPSLAFGTAHLLTRVASDLAVGDPGTLSFTLLQSALRADPGYDRARLLLAGALAGQDATDRALAALDAIPADSIYAAAAATGRVEILADAGRDAAALSAARRLASRPDAPAADIRRLADLHMRLDRPADAVPLYRTLLDRAGDAASWSEWLQYGAALDRAGRWDDARPALERAVALSRDEPVALNYLGYSLIEHRERMPQAQAMLEKAAALQPGDAAITDSLGWSFYLRGQVARALPLIERAAAADPLNAEIGEHLGDVYWRAGRRFEARYAWSAARQVATPAIATRLSAKISDGL